MSDRRSEAQSAGAAPYGYLLVTMALFGSAFTSSKVVVGHVPHDVAAALRFGGGAAMLIILLCLRPGTTRFSWQDLWRAGTVGLIGVFAYNFFYFWGISLAPAIDGSIIIPVLSPVLTTGFLIAARREAATAARIGGLALAVTGSVVFFIGIDGSAAGLTGSRLAGDLIFLAGAACWATYSITSKKVLADMEPLRAIAYATAVGAIGLVLVAIPSIPDTQWSALSATTWANLTFLAVGPTAVAYLFYYRGLLSVSPVAATITMFAVPVFGTITAVLFLSESLTTFEALGAVISIAGAFVAITQPRFLRVVRPNAKDAALRHPTDHRD